MLKMVAKVLKIRTVKTCEKKVFENNQHKNQKKKGRGSTISYRIHAMIKIDYRLHFIFQLKQREKEL